MIADDRPEWVKHTLDKYVVKKTDAIVLPKLGRNLQAEVGKVQSIIDVVAKHAVADTERVRLRNKVQDLLNVLNSKDSR